jgi:uncharacterized membrane protein HdeD (DUF308 family)
MTPTTSGQVIGTPASGWGLELVNGIAILVVSSLLLLSPAMTLLVLVQLLGIYWLVTGILSIVGIFLDSRMWLLKLLAGVLGIGAGIIVIQHPIWSTLLIPATLTLVLGIIGIGVGVMHLVRIFRGGGWGAALLGLLNIGLGILILMTGVVSTLILIYVITILGVVMGILAIIDAFMTRSAQQKQVGLRRPDVSSPAPVV